MLKKIILLCNLIGLLFATPLSLYAVRNNDFTKSSTSFSRKYESERATIGDKKSNFQDKQFDKKQYTPPTDAAGIADKRANMPDPALTDEIRSKEFRDEKKEFGTKKDEKYTGDWHDASLKLKNDNLTRDLSKKYEGKIDTKERNIDMQNILDEIYEKPMQEINKYYFGGRSPDEKVIGVQTAGSQLHEDNGSFWDFLSSKEKINRPAVSFKGPIKKDKTDIPIDGSPPNLNTDFMSTPQTRVIESQSSSQAPETSTKSISENKKFVRNRGNVVSEEEIDAETAKRLDFIKVPDEMRKGKATIKIEVKQDGF